ncbi:hypothetical protein H6S82_13870 [Planktothrix sp. FACHB-1355]|uniref:hypothetical protein n=1 Tax=Planktothrix sp. FACHB-1355 TaxID=2692854 RepID=UPI00168BBDAF|nr:hypothetical protein [Planktothrix sp. FACHB-1355]MBD3559943.1 hypothetical protein [Planktothrix sp. FACHB-1355]
MAGKAVDNSARGVLILILPIALAIVILFKAWPVLLALVALGGTYSVWQRYQWQKWSQQLDPLFHELIQENRGCLTPLDLSIKANLSGASAKQYLDFKAEEFGAQIRDIEDKGTAYFFITAKTLGGIFDDSTPSPQLENESFTDDVRESLPLLAEFQKEPTPVTEVKEIPQSPPIEQQEEPPAALLKLPEETSPAPAPEPPAALLKLPEEPSPAPAPEPPAAPLNLPEEPELPYEGKSTEPIPKKHRILQSLIQSELARRLDVHSSTVFKRRDDPDFSEWSRSRDPEGIAWEYSADTREFYPLEDK